MKKLQQMQHHLIGKQQSLQQLVWVMQSWLKDYQLEISLVFSGT
jgi:hypothetical protein